MPGIIDRNSLHSASRVQCSLKTQTTSLPERMLRAGTVFGSVCLSAQNLENYWSEIDVT